MYSSLTIYSPLPLLLVSITAVPRTKLGDQSVSACMVVAPEAAAVGFPGEPCWS